MQQSGSGSGRVVVAVAPYRGHKSPPQWLETPWDQIMCDRTKWVLPDHLKASVQQVAD